jgi:uncharacterized membrane protein (Fun14 family)
MIYIGLKNQELEGVDMKFNANVGRGTIIGRVIGAAIGTALAIAILGVIVNSTSNKGVAISNEELLKKVVESHRKNLPMKIDKETTWFSVHTSKDELVHDYRYTDFIFAEFAPSVQNQIMDSAPKALQVYVCSQTVYEKYWVRNIKLTYVMFDRNDSEWARFSFDKYDCKK